jgi:hypothetical protein
MERSHHTALNQRPETLDGVGVDRATHVFVCTVTHYTMREHDSKLAVGFEFIGRDKANLRRNCLRHECVERGRVGLIDHASNNVAFALQRADDDCLSRSASAAEVAAPARPFVLVLSLAADECRA